LSGVGSYPARVAPTISTAVWRAKADVRFSSLSYGSNKGIRAEILRGNAMVLLFAADGDCPDADSERVAITPMNSDGSGLRCCSLCQW
jgi:hypothetical protein